MQLALGSLRDGATVGELAGRLGYRSEAAFARAFKRVMGVPPGAVRRRPGPGRRSPREATRSHGVRFPLGFGNCRSPSAKACLSRSGHVRAAAPVGAHPAGEAGEVHKELLRRLESHLEEHLEVTCRNADPLPAPPCSRRRREIGRASARQAFDPDEQAASALANEIDRLWRSDDPHVSRVQLLSGAERRSSTSVHRPAPSSPADAYRTFRPSV